MSNASSTTLYVRLPSRLAEENYAIAGGFGAGVLFVILYVVAVSVHGRRARSRPRATSLPPHTSASPAVARQAAVCTEGRRPALTARPSQETLTSMPHAPPVTMSPSVATRGPVQGMAAPVDRSPMTSPRSARTAAAPETIVRGTRYNRGAWTASSTQSPLPSTMPLGPPAVTAGVPPTSSPPSPAQRPQQQVGVVGEEESDDEEDAFFHPPPPDTLHPVGVGAAGRLGAFP